MVQFNLIKNYLIITVLLLGVGSNTSVLFAAEENQASTQSAETTTSPDKHTTEALEKSLSDIEQQQKSIADLQARIGKSDGILKTASEARLDKASEICRLPCSRCEMNPEHGFAPK